MLILDLSAIESVYIHHYYRILVFVSWISCVIDHPISCREKKTHHFAYADKTLSTYKGVASCGRTRLYPAHETYHRVLLKRPIIIYTVHFTALKFILKEIPNVTNSLNCEGIELQNKSQKLIEPIVGR